MKTSIKDLEKLKNLINIEFENINERDTEALLLCQDKMGLLSEIIDYVNTYDWLKKRDYIEKIKDFINSRCDYKLMAKRYNMSGEAVRNTILYANNRLREKIGERTFELILQGKVKEARKQFYASSGKSDLQNYILHEIMQEIPSMSEKPVDVNSTQFHQVERFFFNYSNLSLQKRLELLDKDSLRFYLYIMQGRSPKHLDVLDRNLDLLTGVYASYDAYEREYLSKKRL